MKKFSKALLIAIFATLIASSVQSISADDSIQLKNHSLDELNKISTALISDGRYEESLLYLDRILETDPNNSKALINKASVLIKLERFEDGIEVLNHHLKFEPEIISALEMKALALVFLGQYTEALEVFDKTFSPDISNELIKKIKDDMILFMTAYDIISGKTELSDILAPIQSFGPLIENKIQWKTSAYQIHLQVVVRDVLGQLVSVSESTTGWYISNNFANQLFDQRLGEKEIITVDKTKYEKVRFEENIIPDEEHLGLFVIGYCADFNTYGYRCLPVFQAITPDVVTEVDDVVTNQWVILRELN